MGSSVLLGVPVVLQDGLDPFLTSPSKINSTGSKTKEHHS